MQGDSWATIINILKTPSAPAEVQLFAAITLRGKVLWIGFYDDL